MFKDEFDDSGVPLPQKWGVLYAHPNPDGSRKRCGNCMMWTPDAGGRCVIHDPRLQITPSMVCGYHVFGDPMLEWVDHPGTEPVDPENSGLEEVGAGTSCDTCVFYEARTRHVGSCHAVAKSNDRPPTPVEAMGCCARWEGIERR
jgi:hypothetical protein